MQIGQSDRTFTPDLRVIVGSNPIVITKSVRISVENEMVWNI